MRRVRARPRACSRTTRSTVSWADGPTTMDRRGSSGIHADRESGTSWSPREACCNAGRLRLTQGPRVAPPSSARREVGALAGPGSKGHSLRRLAFAFARPVMRAGMSTATPGHSRIGVAIRSPALQLTRAHQNSTGGSWIRSPDLTHSAGGRQDYGFEGFRGFTAETTATGGNRTPTKSTRFTARFRQNPLVVKPPSRRI